jgi:hypothetical protein
MEQSMKRTVIAILMLSLPVVGLAETKKSSPPPGPGQSEYAPGQQPGASKKSAPGQKAKTPGEAKKYAPGQQPSPTR